MAWQPLEIEESRYSAKGLSEVRGTTRFLLDNNVDLEVMLRFLDGEGISADELPTRLTNRPDDEVLAEAWRQDRILLTHDPDFLNERLHPPEKNPGVVVMPGGSGNLERHLRTIGLMLKLMKPYRGLWLQTYVHIKDGGVVVIKGVNATSGERIDPWFLTFDDDDKPLMWVSDNNQEPE